MGKEDDAEKVIRDSRRRTRRRFSAWLREFPEGMRCRAS